MEAKRPSLDWILDAENELKALHEDLDRADDQGRVDAGLMEKIRQLQTSLEFAKRLKIYVHR